MSFVTSFGVLPHSRPRSVISSGVLPWELTLPEIQVTQQRKKRRASVQAPASVKATPKAEKSQPAIEPPTLRNLLITLLESQHRSQLVQRLSDDLRQLAESQSIRVFCLNENDPVVGAIIKILRRSDEQLKGSFLIVNDKISSPLIVMVEEEIRSIASALKLQPWVVFEAAFCHEMGHFFALQFSKLGVNSPELMSEQLAWRLAANLRANYGKVSEGSFDRISQHCLSTHNI